MAETKPLRADAARNRERLLAAATALFAERGLAAPLEEVARRAAVSIGTLYNHFPAREDLCDAVFSERMAEVDRLAAEALEAEDAWEGFAGFIEGLVALQAADLGFNDVLAQRYPASPALQEACNHGLRRMAPIIERAKDSAALRPDFQPQDVAPLIWGISQVIRESREVAPQAWRRFLAFFLDGLRAGAAHTVGEPALTPEQLAAITRRPSA